MKRKKVTWAVIVGGLCCFFYILGSWQNSPVDLPSSSFRDLKLVRPPCKETGGLDFDTHHSSLSSDAGSNYTTFEPCDMKFSEYTPCEDTERSLKYPRDKLIYRERHCPGKDELLKCLVPPPTGYKNPLPWPQSRDYTWFANTPHKELTVEKAIQKWVQFQGEKLHFPGGGTFSAGGADKYIDDIAALIPLNDGTVRTAIDTGCGVRKKHSLKTWNNVDCQLVWSKVFTRSCVICKLAIIFPRSVVMTTIFFDVVYGVCFVLCHGFHTGTRFQTRILLKFPPS